MKRSILVVLLVSSASLATAQPITTTSGSNAEANSGSVSGAANDINNAANNNIGTSESNSNSTANSGSVSGSASYGNSSEQGQGQAQGQDQGQMQGQSANNTQGQGQDQGQSQSANSNQGQMQGQSSDQANAQSTSVTFNSTQRKTQEIRTNNAVPLAASSSFSSDYCGGTVSGGASAAPIGISIGGSGPKFDKSCQALRRAEKFGMAAANAHNMQQPELAGRLMTMMIWSICTADSQGAGAQEPTAVACANAGLLGPQAVHMSQPTPPPAIPVRSAEARTSQNGKVTPVAAKKADDEIVWRTDLTPVPFEGVHK